MAGAACAVSRLSPSVPAGLVERYPEGTIAEDRTFSYEIDGIGEDAITLEILPVQRSRKGAMELLSEAVEEWNQSYLGENISAQEVRCNLAFPDVLCDGLVSVSVESDTYSVLDTDGVIHTEELGADGVVVNLTVTLSYSDYTRIENYAVQVYGPEEGSPEWVRRQLLHSAQQAEEQSRETDHFELPERIDGHEIQWIREQDNSWIYLIFLGAIMAFCLEWREKENAKKKRTERNDQLMSEYPLMVDRLAVLLDSGMTLRRAWEKMLYTSKQDTVGKAHFFQKRKPEVYIEEMWITYREMKEGRGERDAYERFGSRIGLMPYRRLGSMLSQNLSKGTGNLQILLRKESRDAFEMRKNSARKAGEEAGTKMLFPMLLMLVLLLLVLLYPAITNF